ncbi:MAG: 30S ribosomal protein S16 [Parcubacteria group bacterium GW2011_GWC2_42_11]|nr:MAG: 30S ribosomal protein S16 [Parcubacteria group bacterium GW2011_GWC2_42_11]
MLMIRLQRVGRKNYAEFRVVVTEKTRAAKSSNYVELVGHYNPHDDSVTVNSERVLYWIGQGAQVSDTVHNLLVSQKVIEGKKKNVLPKKTPIKRAVEEVAEETPAVAVEEK